MFETRVSLYSLGWPQTYRHQPPFCLPSSWVKACPTMPRNIWRFFPFSFIHMDVLPACISKVHKHAVPMEARRRQWISWVWSHKTIVSHHIGDGNRTWILLKISHCSLTTEPSLQPKDLLFYLYVYELLPACLCTVRMPGTLESQNRASDPLELEL